MTHIPTFGPLDKRIRHDRDRLVKLVQPMPKNIPYQGLFAQFAKLELDGGFELFDIVRSAFDDELRAVSFVGVGRRRGYRCRCRCRRRLGRLRG